MSDQPVQTIHNHKQIVPVVHYVLIPLGFVTIVGSIVYAVQSIIVGGSLLASLLLLALSVIASMTVVISRSSALKVQDRLIRTEEELRYFRLTGQWLDSRLTIKQLIALRFASDNEFVPLCERAANENLPPAEIKRAVKAWRGDYNRV